MMPGTLGGNFFSVAGLLGLLVLTGLPLIAMVKSPIVSISLSHFVLKINNAAKFIYKNNLHFAFLCGKFFTHKQQPRI